MFGLFAGRFWWPGEASTWAGFIRSCLFVGLLFAMPALPRLIPALRSNPYAWLLLGLLLYIGLSSLFLGNGKTARRVALLLALLVGTCAVYRSVGIALLRPILVAMVCVSAGASGYALYDHWQQGLLFQGYRVGAIANSGLMGFAEFENSVLASLEMAFSFVSALWLVVTSRHNLSRLALLLLWLPIAVYLYCTFGRSGWLAAAVATAVVLVFALKGTARRNVLIGVLASVAALFALFHDRIAYELFQRSLTHRDEIWSMVLGLMPGHWIFGHGADITVETLLGVQPLGGVDVVINHSHSIYIEVLFNYGWAGLVGFIGVLIGAFCVLWAEREEPSTCLWLAILAGACVTMAFDFSSFVSTPNLLWLWLWFPLGWALAISCRRSIERVEATSNA
ncbi:O-antigen ligase family protein [Pseudomonas sp. Marseille-QA0892]